ERAQAAAIGVVGEAEGRAREEAVAHQRAGQQHPGEPGPVARVGTPRLEVEGLVIRAAQERREHREDEPGEGRPEPSGVLAHHGDTPASAPAGAAERGATGCPPGYKAERPATREIDDRATERLWLKELVGTVASGR